MPRNSSAGCKCPQCQAGTAVVDTREGENNTVMRRRCCQQCGVRFTTVEKFSCWDSRSEGRKHGQRSKNSPMGRLIEQAKRAAKAVPVGSRGPGVKHG
ncbi:MAG TPA: hypothetical protein VIM90_04545 [Arenimonas sp.]